MKRLAVLLMIGLLMLGGCDMVAGDTPQPSAAKTSESRTFPADSPDNSDTGGSSVGTSGSWPETEDAIKTKEILRRASTEELDGLIQHAYPQEGLIGKVIFGETDNFNTLLCYIDGQYPAECIRTFEDGSLAYCVYKLEEGGRLFIFFYGEGLLFADCAFVVKEPLSKSRFDSVKAGQTLKDVEKLDKGFALYNSVHPEQTYRLDNSLVTHHMVREGFVRIRYRTDVPQEGFARVPAERIIVQSVEFIPNGGSMLVTELHGENRYSFLQSDYPVG